MDSKVMKTHPVLHGIGAFFAVLFAVLVLVLNTVYSGMSGLLDTVVSNTLCKEVTPVDSIMSSQEVEENLADEGSILLQNNNNTLPLSKDIKKVNVFGWASTQWLGGGSGSGGVSHVDTDLIKAFSDYGVETNTELTNMYKEFQPEREFTKTLSSYPEQSSRLYEPSINDNNYYSEKLLSDAKSFSDTAIMVVGRLAGESNDMTAKQYKRTTKDGDIIVDDTKSSLALSSEEEELLTYLGKTYENVIVIVNSGNIMELGQLETIDGIDSVIMAGETGTNGAAELPKLIYGDKNFSGKTADTWAYDFKTAASYANAGENGVGTYSNAGGLYPFNGTSNGNLGVDGVTYEQVSYVDYAENIYVGYKWYETADTEGYWNEVSNVYGNGYEGVVQYPFGFGLSYTNFKWEVLNNLPETFSSNDTITLKVKVTNTGDMAGKDVVELYYNPPYTVGGIEKASANLIAFDKTKELEPGESQEMELSFVASDMASYDAYDSNNNGFKGYELESGAYEISLKTDSHNVIWSSISNLDKSASISKDKITGNEVTNKFTGKDALDGFSLDGSDSEQNITFLSRADFEKTFPATNVATRPITDELAANNLYTEDMANSWIDTSDESVKTDAKNNLKITDGKSLSDLGYALGKDFNDERWDDLLDELTKDEMLRLVSSGYAHTEKIESIGKPSTSEADGPAQVGGFYNNQHTTGFSSISTNACTWNKDLLGSLGLAMGHEAVSSGMDGIYAPSTNIHRSPFNGRNYEYFSEDGILAGELCGNYIQGAKKAGVYCFIKHFINNDGESNIYRDSVYVWETEQGLREIYLKPFEIAIEKYGATGLMSSYNRIGAVWSGGSQALLTGILRNEWNFNGAVITDFSDHPEFMNGDQMLRAGGDLWMVMGSNLRYETDSNSSMQALRLASKHIIYMYLNAYATNMDYVNETGLTALSKPVNNGSSLVQKILLVLKVLAVIFIALAIKGIVKDILIRRNRKNNTTSMTQ